MLPSTRSSPCTITSAEMSEQTGMCFKVEGLSAQSYLAKSKDSYAARFSVGPPPPPRLWQGRDAPSMSI